MAGNRNHGTDNDNRNNPPVLTLRKQYRSAAPAAELLPVACRHPAELLHTRPDGKELVYTAICKMAVKKRLRHTMFRSESSQAVIPAVRRNTVHVSSLAK